MLVSVIIPVYNTAEYLADCLESALSQDLEGAEFICVDDGSTDGSPRILEDFARRDSRLRVFTQANAGLSAARNTALDAARGRYIAFLDSDDLLLPGALRSMCAAALRTQADLLLFEYDLLPGGAAHRRRYAYGGPMPGWRMYSVMYPTGDHRCAVWAALFSRELLRRASLRFDEGLLYEDELFTLRALLAAERAVHLYEPLYAYRVRPGSITSSPPSLHKLVSLLHIAAEETALALEPSTPPPAAAAIADSARTVLRTLRGIYSLK